MTKKRMEKIRKMNDENLHKRINEIDSQMARFKAASGHSGGGKLIKVPTSKTGVNWGLFQQLKKEKSRILSVMNERFHKRESIRKPK